MLPRIHPSVNSLFLCSVLHFLFPQPLVTLSPRFQRVSNPSTWSLLSIFHYHHFDYKHRLPAVGLPSGGSFWSHPSSFVARNRYLRGVSYVGGHELYQQMHFQLGN